MNGGGQAENLLSLSLDVRGPLILVAFNYRMGTFGFARFPLSKDERSLNVWLRDQNVACQWVKDQIEAFGGDSERESQQLD